MVRQASRAAVVYGILDLLLAALYLFVIFRLAPSRSSGFTGIATGLSVALAIGGIGMLSGRAWGRRLAFTACGLLLLASVCLVVLLILSAAYLHGIYDGVGEAGAAIAVLAALLAVEVVGLVPALQLAHLLRQRARQQP